VKNYGARIVMTTRKSIYVFRERKKKQKKEKRKREEEKEEKEEEDAHKKAKTDVPLQSTSRSAFDQNLNVLCYICEHRVHEKKCFFNSIFNPMTHDMIQVTNGRIQHIGICQTCAKTPLGKSVLLNE